MPGAGQVQDRVKEAAVSAIGSAAGAVVAPRTAAQKLRSALLSPGIVVPVLAAAVAYVLGRRSR